MKKIVSVFLAFLIQGSAWATSINPLDDGGWELVAHMSGIGGMFDGNGELQPGYSYGSFVASPTAATPDFARAFPVVAGEILFITGDFSVWGIANYADLRTAIDARSGTFAPNLAFEVGINGVIYNTIGNVLSRNGFAEDPWISIEGDHIYAVNNSRIVWGENDYNGTHTTLKNTHGGLNVFVRPFAEAPAPMTLLLFGAALLTLPRFRTGARV